MKMWGVIAAVAAVGIAGCQQLGGANATDLAGPLQTTTAYGVSFEHARGLQTKPCYEDSHQCLILFDPAEEDWMSELVSVEVHNGPLETVAAEHAGFVRNAEGRLMTTYGRFQPVEVTPVQVNGAPALRAIISCGISDPETGFHAGAGDCLSAVISDGKRTVVISSSGYGNGLEATEALIPTLRFLPTE